MTKPCAPTGRGQTHLPYGTTVTSLSSPVLASPAGHVVAVPSRATKTGAHGGSCARGAGTSSVTVLYYWPMGDARPWGAASCCHLS